jgi:hypothetical protein
MTKEKLANQLEHAKNSYIMGLAAYSLFISAQSHPILRMRLLEEGCNR